MVHNSTGLDHLPGPAGNALHNEAQDGFGIFAMRLGCWLMVSLLCTRTLRSFSAELFSIWLIVSQSILLSEVILLHVQDITLPLKHCEISVDTYLQPPEVPLNGTTTMCCFHNFPRVSSDPSCRLLMRKLNQPQHQPLGCTTSDWPRDGLHATDQSSWIPAFQPDFKPPHYPFMSSIFHQFVCKDVIGDSVENLVKIGINNIHCTLSHSSHCGRLSWWPGMISAYQIHQSMRFWETGEREPHLISLRPWFS